MGKVWVRKQGRVCQIYQEPFSDFDAPPETEFPQTIIAEDERHLRSQLPGVDLVIIEKAKQAENTGPRLTKAQLMQGAAQLGHASEIQEKIQDRPVVVPTISKVASTPSDLSNAIITEFRLLLAAYYASPSEARQAEVESVASFLLNVMPELEPRLHDAKASFTERKFKL